MTEIGDHESWDARAVHRRDKKHPPVPAEGGSRKENGPSHNGVHKTVKDDTWHHGAKVSGVSDGRLPSIIVIYSQYHGTRGCCNDALGRDGVHRGDPTPDSRKHDGARRKVGLSSAGRIAELQDVAHAANVAKLEGFLEREKAAWFWRKTFRSLRSADYRTKLTPVSLHPIIFRATRMHVARSCLRRNKV